jgi:hypothetical protein
MGTITIEMMEVYTARHLLGLPLKANKSSAKE